MKEISDIEFVYSKDGDPAYINPEEFTSNKRKSETIVMSNALIEASYKLSLNEQRLIMYMASTISREDKDFKVVRIAIKDFADTYNLCYKNLYRDISKIAKYSLKSKSLQINPHKDSNHNDDICINWISVSRYKKGILELSLSPDLKPYLLELKNNFSRYQLDEFVGFTSNYSIRMYLLLKRYEYFRDGTKYYTLEEIRKIFKLENKYPSYYDLKKRVLESAINEINSKSNIIIHMSGNKEGSKVVGVMFKVISKNKNKNVESKNNLVNINMDLVITVKTLLQTCMDGDVQERDAITLLKLTKNDVSKIMQKILLVQESKSRIDNVMGFLIESIKNNYQAIRIPTKKSRIDYMDNSENEDFEALAKLSRER